MSVRTTVTLDDDVLDRVRCESRSRNTSFRATLNSLLRTALNLGNPQGLRMLKIKPVRMGHGPALNYNDVGRMLEDGMPTCGCAVKRRFASTFPAPLGAGVCQRRMWSDPFRQRTHRARNREWSAASLDRRGLPKISGVAVDKSTEPVIFQAPDPETQRETWVQLPYLVANQHSDPRNE